MNIVVLLKMVPDVVEELEVAPDGKALDTEYLRMIVSESDSHALEEALLLKERHGGKVTVLAPEALELDDALYAALAKGVDRVVKLTGMEQPLSSRQTAQVLAQAVSGAADLQQADLILTGVQAIDDLDGLIAPLLAHQLGLPYLGIVTTLAVDVPRRVTRVIREFPGGVRGEFQVPLPAVLGIQAAEKPPRYVPMAKVRAVMKSQTIESAGAPARAEGGPPLLEVIEMKKPEAAGHAEMLEGGPEEVAGKLADILAERGLV